MSQPKYLKDYMIECALNYQICLSVEFALITVGSLYLVVKLRGILEKKNYVIIIIFFGQSLFRMCLEFFGFKKLCPHELKFDDAHLLLLTFNYAQIQSLFLFLVFIIIVFKMVHFWDELYLNEVSKFMEMDDHDFDESE